MDETNEKKPLIIAFEGTDGCGKTTVLTAVQDLLDAEGIPSAHISMIAKCPAREVLLGDETLNAVQRLMLVGVCAIEAKRQIQQALAEGKIVLLDRMELSRTVYQGVVDGLEAENRSITAMIGEFPHIDYLVYFNIDVEKAYIRVRSRGMPDAIEKLGYDYFVKIQEAYARNLTAFTQLQEHNERCGRKVTQVIELSGTDDPALNAAMIFGEIQDQLLETN